MIDWNIFPLLWTLDNDETDSRSLQCPLLIGISLFHKVMHWLFIYIFLVSLVKVLTKSSPGQEQQRSADDPSSLGIISGIVASSLLIIFIIVGLLLYRHGGLRYLLFCIYVYATDILYWLSLSVSFLNLEEKLIGNPLGIRRSIRLAQKVRWLFLLKLINIAGSWSRINNSIHVIQYPILYQNKEMLTSQRKKIEKKSLLLDLLIQKLCNHKQCIVIFFQWDAMFKKEERGKQRV